MRSCQLYEARKLRVEGLRDYGALRVSVFFGV